MQLSGIRQIDVLYCEIELMRHHVNGDVLSHVCYAAANMRPEPRRGAKDLASTRRKLSRMDADLHASKDRASSLDARVHGMEAGRAYQEYPPPLM